METTLLCSVDDLPDAGGRGMTVSCGESLIDVFLVRRGDEVLGYINSCPHTGAPLDWVPDRFINIDGTHIQCATHDALFNWHDGVCVAGPCAGDALTPLPLQISDGDVFLQQERFCSDWVATHP